jgi:hypothetical protein
MHKMEARLEDSLRKGKKSSSRWLRWATGRTGKNEQPGYKLALALAAAPTLNCRLACRRRSRCLMRLHLHLRLRLRRLNRCPFAGSYLCY